MKKIFVWIFALSSIISEFVLHAGIPVHLPLGSYWGDSAATTYAQTRHGPDGELFLDPFFMPFIQDLNGKVLLDAGCGAGPWAIYAAKEGAIVYGVDIQPKMIEESQKAALRENISDKILFEVGMSITYHIQMTFLTSL